MPKSRNRPRVNNPVVILQETTTTTPWTPQINTRFNGKECRIMEMEGQRYWEAMMNLVRLDLNIPAISSRSDLKKVHANLDAMYTKLETTYRTCPPARREDVRGGIAMIVIQFCMDSILRDKLFEKGVLKLILPLLECSRTRHLAFVALSSLCQHDGFKVQHAVAQKFDYIVRIVRNSLDDFKVVIFGITTITRCMESLLAEHIRADNKEEVEAQGILQVVQDPADMIAILDILLESVKRHYTHPLVIEHAILLLSIMTVVAYDELMAHPHVILFLVAGLRSKNWGTRGKCLGALIRLYLKEFKDDNEKMDPHVLLGFFQNGIPSRFWELYRPYHPPRESEIIIAYNGVVGYMGAIARFRQSELDLCALGMKEAELIRMSERSITGGKYKFVNSEGSSVEVPDDTSHKWLYKNSSDSLPLCAQALRARNSTGDDEMADILDIQSRLLNKRVEDAVGLAENALKRKPDQAFFYYAASQADNHKQGLGAAKKGLHCPNLTPSLRWLLSEQAIHRAGFAGIIAFSDDSNGARTGWKEGIALLKYAYSHAKAFIETAPPDSRLMKQVGHWLVLLTMVMEENLSSNLRELKPALQAISLSEKFWQMIDVPLKETELCLAQKAALKHFDAAQAEFSHVFAASKKSDGNSVRLDNDELSEIASTFDEIKLEDEKVSSEEFPGARVDDRKFHVEGAKCNILMSLCSWCNKPSAALRKCKGCGKVQYCDRVCQKSHWTYHKQWCTH